MTSSVRPPAPTGARRAGWLNNRPVATRILAAVGIASATAVGVGALAVDDLKTLRDARAQELSTALPYLNSLHDIGLTKKATANDERGYLLTGDPEFLPEIEERLAKVDGYLEEARAASNGAQTAYLDELEAGLDAWSGSMQAEFQLFAQNPEAGIALAFGETRDLRKTYEGALKVGLEDAETALLAGASYEQTVSDAVRTMVIVCGLGVLLAAGLGWFVARTIRRSLSRLQDATGRLAEGDLTVATGAPAGRRGGAHRQVARRGDRVAARRARVGRGLGRCGGGELGGAVGVVGADLGVGRGDLGPVRRRVRCRGGGVAQRGDGGRGR
ncbi:CHASE3 domain-containing protein [Blastococcus sp. TBT05-19]|uniref:CHASE3 domain-containing protein n=1 Tax=Blastococcus sp. TBT05-19 TaxID=2250581 RepID=UPI0026A9EEEE